MEGTTSTTNEEVEVNNERSVTFYIYHPCFLLQQVFGTLFKCLGFEIGTNKNEHHEEKTPLEDLLISEENTPSNEHQSSQNIVTSEEQNERSTTTTTQSFVSFSLFSIWKIFI